MGGAVDGATFRAGGPTILEGISQLLSLMELVTYDRHVSNLYL
jgi:hypothetical protein